MATPPSSLKDIQMYEALRDYGASKEKAARISNAAARRGRKTIARKGGEAEPYDEWTVNDLRRRAKELGLSKYSHLRKADLVEALRDH